MTPAAQVLLGSAACWSSGPGVTCSPCSSDRTARSDPGVLASLSHMPGLMWNLSFVLVCAAATWLVATEVLAAIR